MAILSVKPKVKEQYVSTTGANVYVSKSRLANIKNQPITNPNSQPLSGIQALQMSAKLNPTATTALVASSAIATGLGATALIGGGGAVAGSAIGSKIATGGLVAGTIGGAIGLGAGVILAGGGGAKSATGAQNMTGQQDTTGKIDIPQKQETTGAKTDQSQTGSVTGSAGRDLWQFMDQSQTSYTYNPQIPTQTQTPTVDLTQQPTYTPTQEATASASGGGLSTTAILLILGGIYLLGRKN